jgi:hypothetical protein
MKQHLEVELKYFLLLYSHSYILILTKFIFRINYCHFFKMVHYINIHNKSDHDQTFEIHGWNDNKNMTVKANTTAVIPVEDHSSGAIIALHDGHEGEQAEITKDGFGGIF